LGDENKPLETKVAQRKKAKPSATNQNLIFGNFIAISQKVRAARRKIYITGLSGVKWKRGMNADRKTNAGFI
jgi:hypothetical protein